MRAANSKVTKFCRCERVSSESSEIDLWSGEAGAPTATVRPKMPRRVRITRGGFGFGSISLGKKLFSPRLPPKNISPLGLRKAVPYLNSVPWSLSCVSKFRNSGSVGRFSASAKRLMPRSVLTQSRPISSSRMSLITSPGRPSAVE